MSWFFFKVLPDVQSGIHLAQHNIASKLYGNFENLRDSLHNRNDSPWCTSKERQFLILFFFILSSEMLYKYFIFKVTLTNFSYLSLLFCFSFIVCLRFLYLELFLHNFNEKHFFYHIAFLNHHIWVTASGHIILL